MNELLCMKYYFSKMLLRWWVINLLLFKEIISIQITTELECINNGNINNVNLFNDTCIYVTLMDDFGDGWTDCANMYYWVQIRDDDSNIIKSSLDCNCPMRAGCIHPSDLNINQLYYLTVSCNDTDYVPDYAWEIHWTAQIVEGGV